MWQWFSGAVKTAMPSREEALVGREQSVSVPEKHFMLGTPLDASFEGFEKIVFGMGCFWGAERKFWETGRVHSTAAGYAGGYTHNPNYREVCSGQTGHAEVVQVIFDPEKISVQELFRVFWENHDPTQGMRQGNDVGTEYRSIIITQNKEHQALALASRDTFQQELHSARFGEITTEIVDGLAFYFAEDYHQQYLGKNPNGYCGMGGTGVSCPIGLKAGA